MKVSCNRFPSHDIASQQPEWGPQREPMVGAELHTVPDEDAAKEKSCPASGWAAGVRSRMSEKDGADERT